MLKIKNISKSFNGKTVLKKIDFDVSEGEVVLYIGNNGSGKTTTFKIIAGLLSPDCGKIMLNETELSRKDIGYLCEERSLYTDCTVKEHARLIYDLNQLHDFDITFSKWVHLLQLDRYRNTRIDKLSKGNKQKAALLMCLIKNPKVIILDEPFTALDQNNVEIFKRVILRQKREGKIVILSSHLMQNILEICDRYIYLNEGSIVYDINKEKLDILPQKVVWVSLECMTEIRDDIPHYIFHNTIRYYMKNTKQAKRFIRNLIDKNEFIPAGMSTFTAMDYKEFCL